MAKRDRAVDLLREIYNQHGPRSQHNANRVMPASRYAKLTADQIDGLWDFQERHQMHRIAKVLARSPPR